MAITSLALTNASTPGSKPYFPLKIFLSVALCCGCAGKAPIRATPAVAPISPLLAEAKRDTATTRHASGNMLSQWLDRTPALSQSAAFPPAAEDCAMLYDPVQRRLVLFGGKDDANQNVNEVWTLNLSNNTWQKIAAAGELPPASEDHAVIYDPVGYRMILHGGEDGFTTNKTWAFDLTTNRWRNMTDSTAPAREDHTAIFDGYAKRMIIFGGRDNNGGYDYTNIYDIWALDLDPASPTFEKWQELAVKDKHPPGRSDHVAVYDDKNYRMIIFGGWDKDQKELLGDTWAFYLPMSPHGAGEWKQIKTRKSHPPKRRHAAGAYDPVRNWLIVFGGFGEEGYFNDVWAFDLNDDVWLNITPGPQPRLDQQAVFDPQAGRLLIYGGDARLPRKFHDLWELQIQPEAPWDLMKQEAGAPPQAAKKQ